LPDHAAQRRLLVLAARRASRTRRQHRAHSRREIPRALARGRTRRRPARLLSVDLDPALGVGDNSLSLGLPRNVETMADRGPSDPQRFTTAVAGELLRQP